MRLRYFPAGTVHVAVVDPGVGTPRALLVALANEQALLAPDNGLLAPLAIRRKIDRIIRIDLARLVQFGVSDVSATFHGRDVFAPLAAAIASGRCDPVDLGEEVRRLDLSGWPATTPRADGGIAGVVVAVDRFGNLISNIEAPQPWWRWRPPPSTSVACACPCDAPTAMPRRGSTWDSSIPSRSWRWPGRVAMPPQGLNLAVGAPISAVPAVPGAQFRRS